MRATRLAIGRSSSSRDGLLIGSWAARIPAVQHHAGLTNARLGLALFAASLGALVAMPVAGRLCERVGSRASRSRRCSLGSAARSSPRRSRPGSPGSPRRSSASAPGFGAINVAANVQGLALERLSGRPILSSFHAAFSAGGLVGAGLGALAAAAARPARALRCASRSRRGRRPRRCRFLLPPRTDDG